MSKTHYGLSVSLNMDGEGNIDGDSVGWGCYGDWKAQQKCPYFRSASYIDPPDEGDTCCYVRDGFQCGNPLCIITALRKTKLMIDKEIKTNKNECNLE